MIVTLSALAFDASEFARDCLLETTQAAHVGLLIDSVALESDVAGVSLVTHSFVCSDEAYPGWYWAVTVVAIEGQDHCTVSEMNLLPGSDALVPPAWKPWASRVEAGDLGVGDLLPTQADDQRLTGGFTGIDEQVDDLSALHPVQWELGLGREVILSDYGQHLAVSRWVDGQTGPRAAMAKSAPASCSSCGFLVAIGGSLGQAFGICANEFGAADGRIVTMNFGCGAHSSVRPEEASPIPVVDLVVDDEADELSDASNVADYTPEEPQAEASNDEQSSDVSDNDAEKDSNDSDNDSKTDVIESVVDADDSDDDVHDSDDDSDSDADDDDHDNGDDDDDDDDDDESDNDDDDDDESDDETGYSSRHASDFIDHLDQVTQHEQQVFQDSFSDSREHNQPE